MSSVGRVEYSDTEIAARLRALATDKRCHYLFGRLVTRINLPLQLTNMTYNAKGLRRCSQLQSGPRLTLITCSRYADQSSGDVVAKRNQVPCQVEKESPTCTHW